ncbi:protein FAR1-RELATED SEQUENCE 12 [Sesamum angolense]|uniref:Protein FAR1-RELATED SEQUENCE 12 n=1 Tax=Sesamum angolense TaxID=2727404 RepID=A0AAE1X955_9LAMI|nr:protein FAR1-RELATED SEQUENCE 12 [Sesamum angolense]
MASVHKGHWEYMGHPLTHTLSAPSPEPPKRRRLTPRSVSTGSCRNPRRSNFTSFDDHSERVMFFPLITDSEVHEKSGCGTDVELIDVDEGNMGLCGGITDDGDDDSNDGGEMNAYGHSLAQDEERIVHEPHVGMEFDSEDSAKMFYEDYARGRGFGTRVGHFNRSKPAGRATSREFLCSGDGLKKRPGERCKAMLKIELKSENKWVVTKFGKEHTIQS